MPLFSPAPDSRLCVGRARSPRTLLVGPEGGRWPFARRVPRYPPSRRHSRCRLPASVMCAASRNAAAAADPPPAAAAPCAAVIRPPRGGSPAEDWRGRPPPVDLLAQPCRAVASTRVGPPGCRLAAVAATPSPHPQLHPPLKAPPHPSQPPQPQPASSGGGGAQVMVAANRRRRRRLGRSRRRRPCGWPGPREGAARRPAPRGGTARACAAYARHPAATFTASRSTSSRISSWRSRAGPEMYYAKIHRLRRNS